MSAIALFATGPAGGDGGSDEARQNLIYAWKAARVQAVERRNRYLGPGFGLEQLAVVIERSEPNLDVVVADGAASARGRKPNVIILDERTTATDILLFASERDGSIWQLNASNTGAPRLTQLSGKPPKPAKKKKQQQIDVRQNLRGAWKASRAQAVKLNGRYLAPGFTLVQLAAVIERLQPALDVVVGDGPAAARNRKPNVIILDKRTTATAILLFARQRDGSIWQLSASSTSAPRVTRVE